MQVLMGNELRPGFLLDSEVGECSRYICQRLIELRDEYSDEIPKEIVHSTSPNNRFKCRASWWGILEFRVGVLRDRRIIPESLVQEYEQIIRDYKNRTRGITTEENISSANKLISNLITYLQREFPPN